MFLDWGPGRSERDPKVTGKHITDWHKPCEWNWKDRTIQKPSMFALGKSRKSSLPRGLVCRPCCSRQVMRSLQESVTKICSAWLPYNPLVGSVGVEETQIAWEGVYNRDWLAAPSLTDGCARNYFYICICMLPYLFRCACVCRPILFVCVCPCVYMYFIYVWETIYNSVYVNVFSAVCICVYAWTCMPVYLQIYICGINAHCCLCVWEGVYSYVRFNYFASRSLGYFGLFVATQIAEDKKRRITKKF